MREFRATFTNTLVRYWQPDNGNHFYTTQWQELGTNREGDVELQGYVSEGIAGYCMPQWKSQTVALTRFFNAAITDHFTQPTDSRLLPMGTISRESNAMFTHKVMDFNDN